MIQRWLPAWALGSVAFGGASLLVPLYIVQLGATPVQLGYLAATASLIGAPGAIAFGHLANRASRRRELVLLTLGTVGVTLAVVPLLRDITLVIVANAALWLVVGAVAPVLTMLVVDDAPESDWSNRIGRLNRYQGYGWAGGLLVGTAWPLVGVRLVGPVWATRTLFWLLAGFALVSAVSAARSLPRPAGDAHVTADRKVRRIGRLVAESRRGIRGATFAFAPNRLYWLTRDLDLRTVARKIDRPLGIYLAAAALCFTGFAAFWAPLPLLLTDRGFATGQIFGLYLVSSAVSAVCYEPAGRAGARYDLRLLQSGALAARGILFPVVAGVAGLGSLALAFGATAVAIAAIGLTWAVIAVVGTAIVTRLAPVRDRGQVLGVHAAIGAVAGGAGALLGGAAAEVSYLVAFGLAGGLVLLGATLVLAVGTLAGATARGSSAV